MKAAAFDYLKPTSIAEAAAALGRDDVTAIAVAGGQSLVPMLNLRVVLPDLLVDISGLDDLKESRKSGAVVRFGALTTHAAAEDGAIPDSFAGLLPKVASGISYRAVRHYGTIGGSVALADPAADWPVCLLALGADVRIASRGGFRAQAIGDVLQGQYATSLERDEIILGFDIPAPEAGMRWGYFKVARKSGAYANSIAVAVQRGRGGPVTVALGAAAERPFSLSALAGRLAAGETSDAALRDAITTDLAREVPEADSYSTRLHIATVLRALREMQSR